MSGSGENESDDHGKTLKIIRDTLLTSNRKGESGQQCIQVKAMHTSLPACDGAARVERPHTVVHLKRGPQLLAF